MCFQNGSYLAEGCTCFQMATSCRMGALSFREMTATFRIGVCVSKKWRLPGGGVNAFPKWPLPVGGVHVFMAALGEGVHVLLRNGGYLVEGCTCFQNGNVLSYGYTCFHMAATWRGGVHVPKWRLPSGEVHVFQNGGYLVERCTCSKMAAT
jgi:hypothetical protein